MTATLPFWMCFDASVSINISSHSICSSSSRSLSTSSSPSEALPFFNMNLCFTIWIKLGYSWNYSRQHILCNYQINNISTHRKLFCKELLPYFLEWLQLHVLIKCQRCNCTWVMERHFCNPPCLSMRCRRTIDWALVCYCQLLPLLLEFCQRNLSTPLHL